jgi:hypothetical protein
LFVCPFHSKKKKTKIDYERYEDVKKDSTKTNWTLFGYVPQSNKLQVVGSGEGGIEEFTEELNSGTPGYGMIEQ